MSGIVLDEESGWANPSAGQGLVVPDATASKLIYTDDSARKWGSQFRCAVAAQAGFAADTYVTDSGLLVPSFGLQTQSRILWQISASKTAAGVAAPIYTIRIGANQTVADAAHLVLTGPAQSAVADIGILTIMLTVRAIGAAGIIAGTALWNHNAAATGFAVNDAGAVEGTSAGFDMTALAGSFIGLSINGGAAAAWTLTQCQGEIWY